MGVADGPAVVGDDVGDLVLAHGLSLDRAQFELRLLSVDLVSLEATLGVVQNAEVLTSLLNGDNVHDAEGEAGISPDFVVNLDESFLISNDLDGLLAGEGVVEAVPEEDGQGDALAALVGAGRDAGRVDAAEFV